MYVKLRCTSVHQNDGVQCNHVHQGMMYILPMYIPQDTAYNVPVCISILCTIKYRTSTHGVQCSGVHGTTDVVMVCTHI